MSLTKQEHVKRLRQVADSGRPVIGAGAGTGLSAKCAEAGGADLIIIYHSGRYRVAGRRSPPCPNPLGDADATHVAIAPGGRPVAKETPGQAGGCGTHPVPPSPGF